jgi:hypothetical protein
MKEQVINEVRIREALHNLAPNTGASPDYCRGLVMGVWCTLTAYGLGYKEILHVIKSNLPDGCRKECVPNVLKEELL